MADGNNDSFSVPPQTENVSSNPLLAAGERYRVSAKIKAVKQTYQQTFAGRFRWD
jgi:hypothetical protein